ncbi:MAG: 2-amino-4-hydroxy-6-hydroxymethyldihydropteridine diphosphokinase [Desulfobulbaceae bacterium]|nr:2-amino-4-hydroxy-6-hydroxymethyldihydropteridine diphosphokinase [Desulfobulbaceae bacterium]
MKTAYIGLGSNQGNSLHVLREAWKALGTKPGLHLERLSGPYRTEPVGMISQHWFINAAGSLTTTLEPMELLQTLLSVETEFGRVRATHATAYRDRILDLDLLLYENLIFNGSDLVLPHPEIQHRLFVLYPLSEIAPEHIHPRLQCTIHDLLIELEKKQDHPQVEKVSWLNERG